MATIERFEDIEAWKIGRELCKEIGELIDKDSFKRNFRLISQIEGSSGSIMDNISEGFERGSRAEFIQFLGYSKGSCGELKSQLYRSLDRSYITSEKFDSLYNMTHRISVMVLGLIKYLQKTTFQGNRRK